MHYDERRYSGSQERILWPAPVRTLNARETSVRGHSPVSHWDSLPTLLAIETKTAGFSHTGKAPFMQQDSLAAGGSKRPLVLLKQNGLRCTFPATMLDRSSDILFPGKDHLRKSFSLYSNEFLLFSENGSSRPRQRFKDTHGRHKRTGTNEENLTLAKGFDDFSGNF